MVSGKTTAFIVNAARGREQHTRNGQVHQLTQLYMYDAPPIGQRLFQEEGIAAPRNVHALVHQRDPASLYSRNAVLALHSTIVQDENQHPPPSRDVSRGRTTHKLAM